MSKFKIKFIFNGLPDTFCVNHGTLPYPSTKVNRQPLLFETEDLANKFISSLQDQYHDVDYEVVTADTQIPILRDKAAVYDRDDQAKGIIR
jgi:hypothetical protein